jgi:lysyl-tRNA synthetase class 1
MDGTRKVPDNVPNQEMLRENLHRPLTRVPDPFGQYESFGHHNNAMLRRFLDTFGFEYEFASATDYYTSGKFDEILLLAAERYQKIMDIMLPSLGEERQATYSCFLPISPKTGRVLYVPMKEVNAKTRTITYTDEDGDDVTLPVTGGNVKLQWKPDFGARWAALGVDFEMYGKDHMSNTVIYDGICKVLGGAPPEHFVYELFLDEKGEKISKSKGNGLTIDEWLTYATPESLALFMFQKPKSAKKLHFDVIPRAVDDYLQFLGAYPHQEPKAQLDNPVWHIHAGTPPRNHARSPLPFCAISLPLRTPRTKTCCGATSAATWRMRRRRNIRFWIRSPAMPFAITGTSSWPRSPIALRTMSNVPLSLRCPKPWVTHRHMRLPSNCRASSMTSAGQCLGTTT